ncbi:MAG: hypothetical protein Hens3KO_04520 [Henriciella sp.]
MTDELASSIISGFGLYLAVGVLVALIYFFGGVGRIDPAAKGKGMPFRARLLIMPGIIGLWPLMLSKLLRQKEPPLQ